MRTLLGSIESRTNRNRPRTCLINPSFPGPPKIPLEYYYFPATNFGAAAAASHHRPGTIEYLAPEEARCNTIYIFPV